MTPPTLLNDAAEIWLTRGMPATVFRTSSGVVVPAITADQMREVDEAAIDGPGPNLFQMMENAGRSLALMAISMLGSEWGPVVVLAGKGGNGGGGICAARHLANRGADVALVIPDRSQLGPVPSAQLTTFEATGARLEDANGLSKLDPALVIDALLGYSLAGAPRGAVAEMVNWTMERGAHVVSLDLPSGVDATSGEAPGVHVVANETLTLALPKTGLDSPAVGELWLADLGIPAGVYETLGINVPRDLFGSAFRVRLTPLK